MTRRRPMAWIIAEGEISVHGEHHRESAYKMPSPFSRADVRLAVGFLPKCLAWYLPKRPVG